MYFGRKVDIFCRAGVFFVYPIKYKAFLFGNKVKLQWKYSVGAQYLNQVTATRLKIRDPQMKSTVLLSSNELQRLD